MDKALIINSIREHYKFKNDSEFARFLEISSQVLSNWKARNTYDAELIYTKCLEINPEWLLTGKGNMLKKEVADPSLKDEISNLLIENSRLNGENLGLKETNELLRFKVGVLEEKLHESGYTRPDSSLFKSVAGSESELSKKSKKDEVKK